MQTQFPGQFGDALAHPISGENIEDLKGSVQNLTAVDLCFDRLGHRDGADYDNYSVLSFVYYDFGENETAYQIMKKIRTAIFGTGFMGRVHTEGARRLGNVEVVAVAGSSEERARAFADRNGIERATGDWRELLADESIEAVHILTPNELHFPMAKVALEAGKHVVCEKPLATSVAEGEELVALAKRTGLAHCTFFNIRAYPQAQNMRAMVEAGEIGEVRVVQGTYSQDWLLYDTDWNWRIESGPSRTFADIGSHWCDLAEFVTGLRIGSLCADLNTFHKTRRKPKGPVETFAGKMLQPGEYTEVPIDTEDYGGMIFRLGEGARGALTVSQVSAGRKNRLALEVYGTKGGFAWDGERQDELWIGRRNSPNLSLLKDPALLHESARAFADLPGGHSEGYDDTFKQTLRRFYRTVADRNAPVEYPVFADGLRQLKILETVLRSSREHAWAEVAD
jgi:predicted dehydrogenase